MVINYGKLIGYVLICCIIDRVKFNLIIYWYTPYFHTWKLVISHSNHNFPKNLPSSWIIWKKGKLTLSSNFNHKIISLWLKNLNKKFLCKSSSLLMRWWNISLKLIKNSLLSLKTMKITNCSIWFKVHFVKDLWDKTLNPRPVQTKL